MPQMDNHRLLSISYFEHRLCPPRFNYSDHDVCSMCDPQLQAGQGLIIPGGWPYASVALEDSLAVGAQMLTVHNMRLQVSPYFPCHAIPRQEATFSGITLHV